MRATPTRIMLGLMALALAGGCGRAPETQSQGVEVVATTSILGDIVQNVVDGDGEVTVLIPVGVDPHDYEASSREVALIQEADLVVANGLDLEEGLGDVLDGASGDGVNVLLVGGHVDPLPFGDEFGAGEHSLDPHFWLDPIRVAAAAETIAAELAIVEPAGNWEARSADYGSELEKTDAAVVEILGDIPGRDRKLVTSHRSLGYFAARYGFEVIGTVVPGGSTLADPSSAELAELVDRIRSSQIRAIFAETTEPTALADVVAAEIGEEVAVVELHTGSLGEPGSSAETLIGLLLSNAELIAGALS